MDQRDWARDSAVAIGERIAFYRERQGLSAQQLAGRCSDRGMPSISRVVITKLENGRREAVSTAELQILAEALDVPAVLLLFPIGYEPVVEVLPGREMTPWDACQWFLGGAGLVSTKASGPDSPIALWVDHEHLADRIRKRRDHFALLPGQASDEAEPPNLRKAAREAFEYAMETEIRPDVRTLYRLRQQMRQLGMTPPEVDPETARDLGEVGDDGIH